MAEVADEPPIVVVQEQLRGADVVLVPLPAFSELLPTCDRLAA